ncbi:hypothetical protein PHYSODRAFT_563007 [Phytophthora sojae]|uniref:Uncharacterized protein n=1 Tax=Phytophthora sojae (strain P6497) TaxID=1094619 RepID=G4ZYQ2_PHYSP|nr:hypothetical protein PHYSODRAFT_563007 [Phytophthora sojae]EGZ12085.1 hypothetical protein PHYSODRAFT_563007 [Phytophthora sojae]|eukprot:XP_009532418.1 hypothetical protein PHYSODRAFT_563007 [Phytophthora sojae]
MACTSPNQWALASPTASSSSRSSRAHLASGDRQDEAGDVDLHDDADRGDALLGHVRQLIVDLLLARVLLELAAEQDNLRLAANAGNALLEELSTAREEIDALHDELEAAQLDRDRAVRDAQRLHEQNAALETELQRYDAPYSSWDSTGQQNALSHLQQRQQQQRRPSITSRSGSFSRTDSCERCASREVELTQLEQRADELRRRCLELELVREREQQRQRELCEEITQLQQRNNDHHLETARAQQDLEFVTSQLEQQTQEVERVQAVRDTLRRTARRLEAENEDLQARLAARDELVAKLESSKARAATQLQVAENRTASAQAETLRVTETLEQLQKQLENALRQSDDMELLLEDATREVAALRLENRILRRQTSAEASSEGSRGRSRRRRTMCTGSSAMTAADVLALDNRGPYTASASSKSDSGSDIESTTTTPSSRLPPLEIESIDRPGSTGKSAEVLSAGGKKHRNMALELSWVDQAATPADDAIATEPSVVKRSALSRLSHVNEHCAIGGSTEMNSPDVRLHGMEGERSARRVAEHPRTRELPIDELKKEAVEPPPQSPLYLGLSFIACATAATAAGLLARR